MANNDHSTSEPVFYKVERVSNWGYWDELNGKPVIDGRHLIKWLDGSITEEDVKVYDGKRVISDMGHPADIKDSYAYVVVSVRGVDTEIKIAGLEACRLDPEPPTRYEQFMQSLEEYRKTNHMSTYRNASDRTIKAGEAVYIDGENVYPANPKVAKSFHAVLLTEVASGKIILDKDIAKSGSVEISPPDHPAFLK